MARRKRPKCVRCEAAPAFDRERELCAVCVIDVQRITDNQMYLMRGIECLGARRWTAREKQWGFLNIMHPEMPLARKLSLVASIPPAYESDIGGQDTQHIYDDFVRRMKANRGDSPESNCMAAEIMRERLSAQDAAV